MSNLFRTVGNTLFGKDPTPSTPTNMTPSQFQNLAGPLSQQLMQQLGSTGGQSVAGMYQPYSGPFAAQMGQGEQAALAGVANATGGVGQPGAGDAALLQQAQFAMNPYARLSGLERYGLQNVAQQAFGQNPLIGQAQGVLGQQLQGQMNPFAQAAGLSGMEQMGLNQIAGTAFGQNPLQNTVTQSLQQLAAGGAQNPYAQQLMDAAVRPIMQGFDDAALQQRGLYTQAGQQVQGQGSSPFAQASARLVGNVANAVGDTTAQLGANLFAQQQQSQLNALQMAQNQPGLTLQNQLAGQMALGLPREVMQSGLDRQATAFGQMQQNQLAGVGLSDQLTGNALQRALAGLGAAGTEQQRQGAAFESAADRQLNAGSALSQQNLAQQQAQLQAQLSNLQAQGLPRLIEQLGIEGGLTQYQNQLAQFQQQQSNLMQLYQLMGGLAQPTVATIGGTPGTQGLVQAWLSGGGGNPFPKGG